MRLKVIPKYIPPNYLSIISSINPMDLNNVYKYYPPVYRGNRRIRREKAHQEWIKWRSTTYIYHSDQEIYDIKSIKNELHQVNWYNVVGPPNLLSNYTYFQLDFSITYIQLDFAGFNPVCHDINTNQPVDINTLTTKSDVEFQAPGWMPSLFARNLDSLEPILDFLKQNPYFNDFFLELRETARLKVSERVVKDLFRDELAKKPRKAGEPFYLLQIILIKLIHEVFLNNYHNWNFRDTDTRQANYFEFLNPKMLNNISRDIQDREVIDLPNPENCFFVRKKHLYFNQDVFLPCIDKSRYTQNKNSNYFNFRLFKKDQKCYYHNYYPELDLALLEIEENNGSNYFVYVRFDYLKYRLSTRPEIKKDDSFVDVNSGNNNINLLLSFESKTNLPYFIRHYNPVILGISKSSIFDIIKKSGLKFNQKNFPTLYHLNRVSDKIYLNSKIKSSIFDLIVYFFNRYVTWPLDEDIKKSKGVNYGGIETVDLVDLKYQDNHNRDYGKIIGYCIKVPYLHPYLQNSKPYDLIVRGRALELFEFRKGLNICLKRIFNLDIAGLLDNNRDYDPNIHIGKHMRYNYIRKTAFKLLDIFVAITLYSDFYNKVVKPSRNKKLLSNLESSQDVQQQVQSETIKKLKKQERLQAGLSSKWLSQRQKQHSQELQDYSNKYIKPYLDLSDSSETSEY